MRTVAIIQARMLSTRLPGKVLADLEGRPVLHRVIERARRAATLDEVTVATSDDPADDAIAGACQQTGVRCFRGSQDDVLDRYYEAARYFLANTIVRITADCPLLDPQVVDELVRLFQTGDYDYAGNVLPCTYPDGLDAEVMRFSALERAWQQARWASEREHVTAYLYKHPAEFRIGNLSQARDLSALRWTVDEPEDLEFVRAVYRHCGPGAFGMADVLRLLHDRPELAAINARFQRNEGYAKSVREDHLVETATTT